MIAHLRTGAPIEVTTAPRGLAPGQHGLQVGGSRAWVRELGGDWRETGAQTVVAVVRLASAADSIDELLEVLR